MQPLPKERPLLSASRLQGDVYKRQVYKMLSIGTSIPGSGLADSLIAQYLSLIHI